MLLLLRSRSPHAIAELNNSCFFRVSEVRSIGGFDVPIKIGQQEVPKTTFWSEVMRTTLQRSLRLKFNIYLNLFLVRSKQLPKHFSKQNVTSSSEKSSFTSDKGIFHNKTG